MSFVAICSAHSPLLSAACHMIGDSGIVAMTDKAGTLSVLSPGQGQGMSLRNVLVAGPLAGGRNDNCLLFADSVWLFLRQQFCLHEICMRILPLCGSRTCLLLLGVQGGDFPWGCFASLFGFF